jgi:hypothetical protein
MTNPSTHEAPIRNRTTREPIAGARPRAGVDAARREQLNAAAWLSVLAGIWLIIAPFVLSYGAGDQRWSDIIFGAITAIVGLACATMGRRMATLSVINLITGAWVFASAFWLDSTGTAMWNDIILGIVIFLLALAAGAVGTRKAM